MNSHLLKYKGRGVDTGFTKDFHRTEKPSPHSERRVRQSSFPGRDSFSFFCCPFCPRVQAARVSPRGCMTCRLGSPNQFFCSIAMLFLVVCTPTYDILAHPPTCVSSRSDLPLTSHSYRFYCQYETPRSGLFLCVEKDTMRVRLWTRKLGVQIRRSDNQKTTWAIERKENCVRRSEPKVRSNVADTPEARPRTRHPGNGSARPFIVECYGFLWNPWNPVNAPCMRSGNSFGQWAVPR